MTRLVFLGSPEPAATVLSRLVRAGHEIVLVVTAPDRRRARGARPSPTPVKLLATELALPVTDDLDAVRDCDAELGVVVAYGRLVAAEILDMVPMVNLHFSLLPRWRGAAPVERAILAGDSKTGVCLMRLDEHLDAGPLYGCEQVTIGPAEKAVELVARLATLGAELLVERLSEGIESLGQPVAQHGPATYAAKITTGELQIAWSSPAIDILRTVRAGRAHTTFRSRRLIVLEARPRPTSGVEGLDGNTTAVPGTLFEGGLVATGDGLVELVTVQSADRRPQSVEQWWRGARPRPGERLGI